MRLRALFVALVFCIAFASYVSVAAAGGTDDTCQSFTKRTYLGSGTAITLRVAYVDAVLQICQDRSGFMTRAAASQTAALTGVGTTTGFVINPGAAIATKSTAAEASAEFRGQLSICLPKIRTFCDRPYPYTIKASFSPVGPTLHDNRRPQWSVAPASAAGVHYYDE